MALVPPTEIILSPASAQTGETRFEIDIPAGLLSENLARFSEQTSISVGLAGMLPPVRTKAVHGRMRGREALRRLLAGTGFAAGAVAPRAYRIERVKPPRPAARAPIRRQPQVTAPRPESAVAPPEIVITGPKRTYFLGLAPFSISVVSLDTGTLQATAPTTEDMALAVEGLALTNLGPGRNRQFIRGVADSPFSGPSQSTVAIQLDDARITFDAPNPDLHLLDVERVEILKGPQGPLYGTGALGGIYRIVTRRPDTEKAELMSRLSAEGIQHGGVGGGAEGIVNLPLATGRLAVRAAGYAFASPGWIDNAGQKSNANATHVYGGRIGLRWRPGDDWTVDLAGVLQNLNVDDSQYVLTSEGRVRRDHPFAEPTDNDFRMLSAAMEGKLGAVNLVSATSYVYHTVDHVLDATAAGPSFALSGPVRFQDDRDYSIVNQEVRISEPELSRWVAGLSFMRSRSRSIGTAAEIGGAPVPVQALDHIVTELAAFGEITLPLVDRLDANLGARVSRTITEDEASELEGLRAVRTSQITLTPSLSLSWSPRAGKLVFLRYARALRPGGLLPGVNAPAARFQSDKLDSLDLGTRLWLANSRLAVDASLFFTNWGDIQSDFLLPNGLVSTRNAGRGRILGVEASAEWRVDDALTLFGGFSAQSALLVRNAQGIKLHDRRLPVVPDLTARLGLSHGVSLGGWRGKAAIQANYLGHTRLTFDEDLDRQMGGYATVSSFLSLARGHWTLAAQVENLLDIKGDSFAFGNPFSIRLAPQYTPLRPRSLTISLRRDW